MKWSDALIGLGTILVGACLFAAVAFVVAQFILLMFEAHVLAGAGATVFCVGLSMVIIGFVFLQRE